MNSHRNVSRNLVVMGLLLTGGWTTSWAGAAAAPATHREVRAGAPQLADPGPDIDRLFSTWTSGGTPGCAIGISRKGLPDMVRAYGEADLEHGIRTDAETVFEAGSSSKQFTAAAVLRLAERGQVALDDDVRKYIPELPDYGHVITLDHLLHHTSGLRDWGGVQIIAGWPRTTRIYTMEDTLRIAARQKSLNFVPGTQYSYTNTGYNLLALIVQRASGKSLAEFSRTEFFEPLGMRNTQWRDDFRRVVKNRAIAYAPSSAGYVQLMPFENAYGNGGLLTTVGDLLAWNAALSEGKLGALVTTGLAKQGILQSGHEINYARGLIVSNYRGYREVAHPGATAGYTAWLGRYPTTGLSIAVLCNAADIDASSLAHAAANLLLPHASSPSPLETSGKPRAHAIAADGLFVEEATGMPLTLKSDAGRITLDDVDLSRVSKNEYRNEDLMLRFEGRDRFLLQDSFGAVSRYKSMLGFTPKPGELEQFVGEYASDEAEAVYVVTLQGGHLTIALRERPEADLELAPAYRDAFMASGSLIRFRREQNGAVSELSMGNERVWDLRFRRISSIR